MATDYGTGIGGPTDLPAQWYYASGLPNLANNIARRLMTPRGSMSWAPTEGYDVRQLVNLEATARNRAAAEAAIAAEVERDDRVVACDATITRVSAQSILVALVITASDGTFPLVLSVNSLTVSVLG